MANSPMSDDAGAPQPSDQPPEGASPPLPRTDAWVGEAWRLVIANVGVAVGMALLPAVIMLVAGVIMFLSVGGSTALAQHTGRFGQALGTGGIMLGTLVSVLVFIVAMPALQLGVLSCVWEMTRTKKLTFEHILDGAPLVRSAAGLGFLFSAVGLVLAVATALIPILGAVASIFVTFPLAAWAALAFYDVAIRKTGAIEAMTAGWDLLMRDFWNLSLLAFICSLIALVGVAACVVGSLVAQPVVNTVWGLCYRDLTGADSSPAQ